MQIVTGIEVNSEAYFPKLREYCPSAEGTWVIFPQLREIRHFTFFSHFKGVMLWAADVCFLVAVTQPGPVSSISLGRVFLS